MRPDATLRLFTICSFALALIGSARADFIPPCTAPHGVSVSASLDKTPPALKRTLRQYTGEMAAPGEEFDATDVHIIIQGQPPKLSRRLIFIWNAGTRWIVATEHGGIGYNDPIFAFDLSQDGKTATLVEQRLAIPNTVCTTATDLLNSKRQ